MSYPNQPLLESMDDVEQHWLNQKHTETTRLDLFSSLPTGSMGRTVVFTIRIYHTNQPPKDPDPSLE